MRTDTLSHCRSCGSSDLFDILDFGQTPLADRLVSRDELLAPDPTAPLAIVGCARCSLVQLVTTVAPNDLFKNDYPYYSSVSPQLLSHFEASARRLISRFALDETCQVVELASNDGYLLKHFHAHSIPVLGIDPADGQAARANEAGIETVCEFFDEALADQLVADRDLQADLVLANNVLAHVPDINGFVAGIAKILKQDGCAVIESPYLLDLVDKIEFDTIYHQHVFYYSVTALKTLFERHDLYIQDIERIALHGGSVRLYVGREKAALSDRAASMISEEARRGISSPRFYETFCSRIADRRETLIALLSKLKRDGNRIVAYGAAAKATTLLAWCGLGRETLDYVVDRSTDKHGRFMPGSRLEILPTEELVKDRPDYVLILAWNFAEEIMRQQAQYCVQGGRFIIPLPDLIAPA